MTEEKSFVEQAEYIPKDEFLNVSSDHPNEVNIIRKLTQSGAKLITGPRGCGKTTLILKSYYKLLKPSSTVLPIYVNYKTSLKLEPYYRKKSNGTYIFTIWMYLKIIRGLTEVLTLSDIRRDKLSIDENLINHSLESIELGNFESISSEIMDLSIDFIQSSINNILAHNNKKRCVIYFDDAAHAFSSEQQHDFFELFRRIKNKQISPKAAIYPGITNFSPTFNVGHDAEEINVWINPESNEYYGFMLSLLEKRLPEEVLVKFHHEEALLKVVCYSCFGLPRQLLNTVRNLYSFDNNKLNITFNKNTVIKEVRSIYNSTFDVFTSLEEKLPIYKNYIIEGDTVYSKIIDLIYDYNREKDNERKSFTIAIKKPVFGDLKKILGFFQYAGLVAYKDQVSRGEKGTFDRYLINIAALIHKNAILTTRSINIKYLSIALSNRNAHEFTRASSNNLLSRPNTSISLTLPPCQNCGTERLNEEAKFCHNCGTKLKTASVYKNLIEQDIKVLKLTDHRINTIKKNSSINKIKDIITDIGNKELKNVPQVGDHWTTKINQLAEEYIS